MDGLPPVRLLIPLSALLYLGALLFIGIYGATRKEGRGDWFRSGAVQVAAVVFVAIVSVLPTEIASIAWIGVLQDHADVTANLFVLVSAPAVAVMIALQALVLSRVYGRQPLRNAAVFLVVHAATYAFWLSRIFNPPADIASYAAVILVMGGIVMALFARFVWRRPG